MDSMVAALDGGGTKTLTAWADRQGRVGLGVTGAGCNPQDGPHWAGNLQQALAGLPEATAHATMGIAGFGEIAAQDEQVLSLVAECFPGTTEVLNDVTLAYRGAFPDGGGVLVLAGTGSMAMASGPKGLQRTGGWGDAYGDEGSAHWIGRAALALASKQGDGREPDSGFAAALAVRLGLAAKADPYALLGWVIGQEFPRSAVAAVARHVDVMADLGDAVAIGLLNAAAVELHHQMLTAARLAGLDQSAFWAGSGSVLASKTLRQALALSWGAPPVEPVLDALGGGLWLAARAAGWPVDRAWASKIATGLSAARNERPTK